MLVSGVQQNDSVIHIHIYMCIYIYSFFIFFSILVGVLFVYNVVLVSGVQQSDSVIYTHISTPFYILFPNRPLQGIE